MNEEKQKVIKLQYFCIFLLTLTFSKTLIVNTM